MTSSKKGAAALVDDATPNPTRGSKGGLGIESVHAIIDGLRAMAESAEAIAVERTKQEEIRSRGEAQLARIHSMRDVLTNYLDRSFDERRSNFEYLFRAVDRSIESGDPSAISASLNAVVSLATSSPFKALTDIASAREELRRKESDWDL